jgi:hypothetical protein
MCRRSRRPGPVGRTRLDPRAPSSRIALHRGDLARAEALLNRSFAHEPIPKAANAKWINLCVVALLRGDAHALMARVARLPSRYRAPHMDGVAALLRLAVAEQRRAEVTPDDLERALARLEGVVGPSVAIVLRFLEAHAGDAQVRARARAEAERQEAVLGWQPGRLPTRTG